jgi:hypothetical protein
VRRSRDSGNVAVRLPEVPIFPVNEKHRRPRIGLGRGLRYRQKYLVTRECMYWILD